MELKKELSIKFTEEEKEAIKTIMKIARGLNQECGDNPNCDKCPLNAFCFCDVFIDENRRVAMITDSLIRFLEEE